ncbi:MAG: tetratricopeptide repeat protein, partial [bacterium]
IQQNNLDKAIEVLKLEIEKVNPKNEEAWYLLGYVYARQGDYLNMVKHFDKAVELKPKLADKGVKISRDTGKEFISQFGAAMIKQITWGKAFNNGVKFFNDALNTEADSLANSYFEQAAINFKAAGMIAPDSTLAFRNMAAAYMNLGKNEESIEPLKLAMEKNPADVDIRIMLAQVYLATGKDSLGVPVLQGLWDDGVRSEEVVDYLARAKMKTGQMAEAKKIYQEALTLYPDNFTFRYNFGTVLLESEEYDNAIAELQKAYEIDPESADINYNLGAAYLNKGVAERDKLPEGSEDKTYMESFKHALPYLEKSVKMNPDDSNTWFTLGRIAGQLNKIALAGYAFSKGETTKSVFDNKLILGMPSMSVKTIFGEPSEVKLIESDQFAGVEEWVFKKRRGAKGKQAIPETVAVYVNDGRVDAIMVIK